MPNDYFNFKQFTIRQDKCGMKVTSLACIQGAWLPDIKPRRVLDIGAGTGLLTLMGAQKYHSQFDTVEIESEAYRQLTENVASSPWAGSIACHHQDIRDFAKENSTTYDLIISNPPFYANQLKSGNTKINQARHETALTLEKLAQIVNDLLAPDGIFSILLPKVETQKFIAMAFSHALFPINQLFISDNPQKDSKSIVTLLAKKMRKINQSSLTIKNSQNELSVEYIKLLRPYYLNI